MMGERDKIVIKKLQDDLPLDREPFRQLASELGCSQEEVIQAIEDLSRRGIMRRFGAVLRHHNAGYIYNAMVMWEVPEEKVDEAGAYMASFREISHCYLRETPPGWPYNMYCMIHARTEATIARIVTAIAEKLGVKNYKIVNSVRELKKTSMVYF